MAEEREKKRHKLAQDRTDLSRTRMASLGRGRECGVHEGSSATEMLMLAGPEVRGTAARQANEVTAARGTSTPYWQKTTGVRSKSLPWLLDSYMSVLTLGHEGLRDGLKYRACTLAAVITLLPRTVKLQSTSTVVCEPAQASIVWCAASSYGVTYLRGWFQPSMILADDT